MKNVVYRISTIPLLQATTLLSSLGFEKVISTLNEYELLIASQLVDASEIDVTFKDIAGLDDVVDTIKSTIILPLLLHPILKQKSQYFQPPKGVLLYGPPGCGKTMIAKAIAKEANARFLNLEVPALTDKWYGESQKLATAVFKLSEKLQPCIIFIDEIDTFLRARGRNDHEATAMMKAQFMILWDGLNTKKDNHGVIVLGATNRPHDVDVAILRRMPAMFEVPLPNCHQRQKILNQLLINEQLESDIDFEKLAGSTDGFSGSDLSELCRNAVFTRLRNEKSKILEILSNATDSNKEGRLSEFISKIRNVNANDFQSTLIYMNKHKYSYNKFNADLCIHDKE
ncbi:unnamed protein product, partial [Medioppia subpectinata]